MGEHIERDRLVGKPPRLEDAALALVQHRERFAQCLAAIVGLVVLGELRLLACSLLYQPVLPLAGFAILANRRIEREVATEAAVHVDHVLLGDAEPLGDQPYLVGAQVAFLQHRHAALFLAQVEEQLPLVGSGAHLHKRPRAQDVLVDGCLDPPHRIGDEAKALVRLEALDRLHEPDIALRDHLEIGRP